MSGKAIAIFLISLGLIAGAAMYWLQVYAYYDRLDPADVTIRVTSGGSAAPLAVADLQAIDADSSPIRFRACFRVEGPVAGDVYPEPTPLTAPSWFDCFEAEAIGAALEAGSAIAVLGEANVVYGVDRIVALFPDGRGYAWHQINACGEVVFDGDPPPPGCPPVPERPN